MATARGWRAGLTISIKIVHRAVAFSLGKKRGISFSFSRELDELEDWKKFHSFSWWRLALLKSREPVPSGSSTRHRKYLDVKGCHWFDTIWDFQRAYGLSELGFLIAFKNPPGSLIMYWHLNISKKKSVRWSLAKLFICLSWPFFKQRARQCSG